MKVSIALLAATYASTALATSLSGTDPETYAHDVVTGDYERAEVVLVEAQANPDTKLEQDDEIIILGSGRGKDKDNGKGKGKGKDGGNGKGKGKDNGKGKGKGKDDGKGKGKDGGKGKGKGKDDGKGKGKGKDDGKGKGKGKGKESST
jgi:hypothetical protein